MVNGNDGPWSVGDSPCYPARWRMLWKGQAVSNATTEFFRTLPEAARECALRNARWANEHNLAELGQAEMGW